MDYIENLLGHMSSNFNRGIILPKVVEIGDDETFKWRALKNNQFAKRPKNSRTRCTKRNMSSVIKVQRKYENNIVIEIENDISKAEIQEVLTQQTSIEYQKYNGKTSIEPLAQKKELCDENVVQQLQKFRLQDGNIETKSTLNLVKHMSSTFNAIRKTNIDLPSSNSCQLETIRRSNRLRQCYSKNDQTIHPKQDIEKYCEKKKITSLNGQNREMLKESKAYVTNTLAISCDDVSISDEPVFIENKIINVCKIEDKLKKKSTIAFPKNTKSTFQRKVETNKINVKSPDLNYPKQLLDKKRQFLNNLQKNKNSLDDNKVDPIDKLSTELKKENALNVKDMCMSENMFQFTERFSRPMKNTSKITANKQLKNGFEFQNNIRMGCNVIARSPVEMSKIQTTESLDSKEFLDEIKTMHSINTKSPANNKSLKKHQFHKFQKRKEKYLRTLGLLRTCSNTQSFRKFKEKLSSQPGVCFKPTVLHTYHRTQANYNALKNESMVLECACENHFSYFSSVKQCRMECTAIDDVNGRLIKCGNTLEGRFQKILRPSVRLSYQILCTLHNRRFREHSCCPQCGIFCTQGEFAVCSHKHIFHRKCTNGYAVNVGQSLVPIIQIKCLHCGVQEKSDSLNTEIEIRLNDFGTTS